MKKILIVDDSISVRKALERILKPKKVEVLSADSAKVALDILEQHHPELIIADIVMPEMDGYEFCALLKEHERLKTVPVLLISGIVNPEVKSKAKSVKAIGIVKKPFKPNTLLYIVSLIFERLKTQATSEQVVGQKTAETEQSTVQGGAELNTVQPTTPETTDTVPFDTVPLVASQATTSLLGQSAEAPLAEIKPIEIEPIEIKPIEVEQPVETNPVEARLAEIQEEAKKVEQDYGLSASNVASTEATIPKVDVLSVAHSQTAKDYNPEILRAAAQRFLDNVNVDNLWLLSTEAQNEAHNEARCLLHLGSERREIEADLGQYFEIFYRTASDFSKKMSTSAMNSLLLEYPETCYLLVQVNKDLLMVLDFHDISALSMVRYMMRKELPELVAEIEGVPVLS